MISVIVPVYAEESNIRPFVAHTVTLVNAKAIRDHPSGQGSVRTGPCAICSPATKFSGDFTRLARGPDWPRLIDI